MNDSHTDADDFDADMFWLKELARTILNTAWPAGQAQAWLAWNSTWNSI